MELIQLTTSGGRKDVSELHVSSILEVIAQARHERMVTSLVLGFRKREVSIDGDRWP